MIKILESANKAEWDAFVSRHLKANPYHAFAWQSIINKAYGFNTYPLVAIANGQSSQGSPKANELVGLLPLVHLKIPGLGSHLVSMPYFDHGGIIANNENVERQLIQAAVRLGRKLRVKRIELRQLHKLITLDNRSSQDTNCSKTWKKLPTELSTSNEQISSRARWILRSHKVRMVLPLPSNSETLMKSFKSKLRSQINRAAKANMRVKIGGIEKLDDFYHVFSTNMRDLGSPVHDKALPQCAMEQFRNQAWIVVVYKTDTPVAGSMMVGFKDVMINPWSSALRQYSKDSPNMLLYWNMLANAADRGYNFFDFGRSTPGEGTYRFKSQWGAKPQPMYWYTIRLDPSGPRESVPQEQEENKRRAFLAALWRQLPVPISRIIGPKVRKFIDL